MRIDILCLLFSLPALAGDSKPLNLAPASSLDPPVRNETVGGGAYSIVNRGGIEFKKFSTTSGDLFVVHDQPLSEAVVRAGECGTDRIKKSDPGEADLVRVERKLPASQWHAFGALIQKTAKNRCSQYQTAQKEAPALDLGVGKTIQKKDGSNTDVRVFNRNLGTNINLGVGF